MHSILTIAKQTRETHLTNIDSHRQSPEGGDVGEGAEPSKELEGSRGIVYLKTVGKPTRSNLFMTNMLLPMFVLETHPEILETYADFQLAAKLLAI